MTVALPSAPARWWRPLERADRTALLWIVLLPVALFAVPALFGYPALAQDNLIQNFPLRVLSAQQIASGHLPLLNPLANSGTPLLGGMNAGSFFPTSLFFVFLPAIFSWVLNLIGVYIASALGMFALLRWHGLRPLPALVAGLTYSYSGAMMGQLVHLGVAQGFALLPWAVLVLLALAAALQRLVSGTSVKDGVRVVAPYVLAMTALWGLTALSGEPRAIAEMELVTLIVTTVVLTVRSDAQPSTWPRRALYVGSIAAGVSWGSFIGMAQLVTGWSFINVSERTGLNYHFFGSGSLLVRWSSLLMIPDLVGGNGVLGRPRYFVGYNLPEVTGYVGVLALVATAGFATRLTRRGWRGEHRNYVVYVVLVVVGLFAAWGSYTPLGHLFQAIPLVGSTRLQSRNIILVDLGLTALLGWWLQRVGERDWVGAGLRGRRRWVTLSPALAVGALAVAMLTRSATVVGFLSSSTRFATMARAEWPTTLVHLVVALALVVLLVRAATSRHLVRWLLAVTAIDVALFLVFCAMGFVAGHVNVMPTRSAAVAQLGSTGRFALVDPSGVHQNAFQNLGSPNMNVFTKIPSVQGYGSLVNALYGNVTASHPLFSLNPCQMATGTFRQLRLAAIAVSTTELATPLSATTPPSLRCLALERSEKTQRYFGQLLAVRSIDLVGANGHFVARGAVSAQLLNAFGKPFGAALMEDGAPTMAFNFAPYREVAAGVEIHAAHGALLSSADVVRLGAHDQSFRMTTPFQLALSTSAWQITETTGTMTIFRATLVRPSAWLVTHGATSRITSVRNAAWGDSWISVRAAEPSVLKRSMEWIPGWRATALNLSTGRTQSLTVERAGLIQQVIVPRGSWTVHFHYHAPHIEVGLGVSLVGVASFGGALVWVRRGGAPRRKGKVRT